jgi:DNA (cytosine-5)-methyltransferase 1
MGKYSCEKCAKSFSQKSHYDKHLSRKTPCEIQTDKIKVLIDKAVEEKLIELNKKLISNNTENNITINMTEQIDISKMNKLELLEKCKELGITKCSSKNKGELICLINDKTQSKKKVELIIEDDEIIHDSILNEINKKEHHTDLNNSENIIKIVSLFAGCGGLDFGFHNNPKYKHVLVNDVDKDACDTYEHNFGIKPNCSDVKKLIDIPDFDLLIGGFPCQGFSMANPYRTETDERNKLYLEILRILNQKKPSYFILENVKGILNMGGYDSELDKKNKTGRIVKNIVEELKICGYKVQYKLFEFKKFNIPQKRERVIFIGVRNDIDFEIKWPIESNTELTLKDAIGDLPIDYINEIQHIGTKHKCNVNGFLGNRELKWDEPSPTITGRGGGSGGPVIHNHPSLKRRLTVRECARIQTFPDNFIFKGSLSSMYKQIGNAVSCNFSVYLSKIFN